MARLACVVTLLCALGCGADPGVVEMRARVAERVGQAPHFVPASEGGERPRAAPPPGVLDADRAVAIAFEHSPRLDAALADLGVTRAQVLAASRPSNPELHATVIFDDGAESPDLELSATQSVTDLLLAPLERSAATRDLSAARLSATGAVIDLAFDVRRAFYAVQAAEQRRALVAASVAAAQVSADVAGALREAGNISELDRDARRVLHEEMQLALARAEADALSARERLGALLGLADGGAGLQLAEGLAEPDAGPAGLDDLEGRALEASLELAALRLRREAAERAETAADVRGFVPEVHGGVAVERDDGEWGVGPTVGVSLPLFDQGQGPSQQARSMAGAAAAAADRLELDIRAAARSYAERLRVARVGVERRRDTLLPLYASVVERTQEQYNAMQVGVFRLLDARRAELAAREAYVGALLSYWLQRTAVEQLLAGRMPPAAGGMDELADAPAARVGAAEGGH